MSYVQEIYVKIRNESVSNFKFIYLENSIIFLSEKILNKIFHKN